MDYQDLFYRELDYLRQELNNLKSCQITFLTFSVTTTALLLGLSIKPGSTPVVSVIPLSPLLILLPSWWIFTDKATTITRIVGYYRILEKLILGEKMDLRFIGWENALEEFRQKLRERKLKYSDDQKGVKIIVRLKNWLFKLIKLAFPQKAHTYLVITWYTFFGLSVLCIVLSIYSSEKSSLLPTLIASIIVVFSSIHNGWVVWQLIYGRNSYTANEYFWKIVLKEQEVDTNGK